MIVHISIKSLSTTSHLRTETSIALFRSNISVSLIDEKFVILSYKLYTFIPHDQKVVVLPQELDQIS